MPRHDETPLPPSIRRRRQAEAIRDFIEPRPPSAAFRRRRKRDLDDGGVTVDPTKPRGLSGGAAVPLTFDDNQSA